MMDQELILVRKSALPAVFEGVLAAKEYLANHQADNISEAIRMAGISRTAFYKYRDSVFRYQQSAAAPVNLSAVLSDKAGVFSAMTAVLCQNNANIITVNQGLPVDGSATVSLTVQPGETLSNEQLLAELRAVDGVLAVKIIS
ncbi:MAG: ACT domain-containing protein [Clostridia bacterium]|nr:ACT domain-containing protein [Clostridia bacterium]